MSKTSIAVILLACAACTGDVCSQEESLLRQGSQVELQCLNAELKDAGLPPWDGGLPTCTINLTTCETGLKSCTAADIQVIQTQLTCASQELSQESATCAVPTSPTCQSDAGVSAACAQAFANGQFVCDAGAL